MSDIDKTLNSYTGKVFDEIKHVMDDSTTEFWSARELQETLEYAEWRNFMNIIGSITFFVGLKDNPILNRSLGTQLKLKAVA